MKIRCFLFLLALCSFLGYAIAEHSGDIFVPTKEWKEIKPGQSIPRGLHVRMDLSTGKREAKLLDDNEESADKNSVQLVEKPESEATGLEKPKDEAPVEDSQSEKLSEEYIKAIKEHLDKIDEDSDSKKESKKESTENKFRSAAELKSEMKALDMDITSDMEILKKLSEKYKQKNSDSRNLELLDEMELLVHHVDNAMEFTRLGKLHRANLKQFKEPKRRIQSFGDFRLSPNDPFADYSDFPKRRSKHSFRNFRSLKFGSGMFEYADMDIKFRIGPILN